ncbi:MAG: sulfatase-like hydrolase/transferase [Planctomycetes bacterium]|nr:sulfatase-like hydrolase/transferase [Planctomycetota bacterium]
MRKFQATALFLWFATLPCMAQAQGPLNVLFIAVDDLRPELGVYGGRARTPNLDRLAATGLTFDRAYCNFSLCNPSRASLMTGRRPDTVRIWDNQTHFRSFLPNVVTLPQHFKNHGYFAKSLGKIYHTRDLPDDPQSWSDSPDKPDYDSFEGTSWRVGETDDLLPDRATAHKAIQALNDFQSTGQPFFLAVGFIRPHLPFVAPQEYYDFYKLEDISLPRNNFPPQDAPPIAIQDSPELREYPDIGSLPIDDEKARQLIRAYLAATSFTDAQVGLVLDELDRLGLKEKTVIVLWGDHGWHLREHAHWGKLTNFDIAGRVPLIISVPGQATAGARTDALVELVDLYPTLCERTGLPLPEGLEGRSVAPLLENPEAPWKAAVFFQARRSGESAAVLAYSIRTDRYRYAEWVRRATGDVLARELYDHETDPDENVNIAGAPENGAVVAQLGEQLAAGPEGALTFVPDPPRAAFKVTPETGEEPLEVEVDASASTTEAGHSIVAYEWDFGDTTGGSGPKATHSYRQRGRYVIRLLIRDDRGIGSEMSRIFPVSLGSGVVAPWTSQDIGAPAFPGASRLKEDCLLVFAGGRGISGINDQFHFLYQELTGDAVLVARIAQVDPPESQAQVGLMFRGSLEAGAPHASMLLRKTTTSRKWSFLYRETSGGNTRTSLSPNIAVDEWVKMERRGNLFVGSYSQDGTSWTELGRATIDMPEAILAGAAATATDTRGDFLTILATVCNLQVLKPAFARGDCNGDGTADISDAISHLTSLFIGGDLSDCLEACDTNDDSASDVSDAIYLLEFLFTGGPAPEPPFPGCGPDPEPGGTLGCQRVKCE